MSIKVITRHTVACEKVVLQRDDKKFLLQIITRPCESWLEFTAHVYKEVFEERGDAESGPLGLHASWEHLYEEQGCGPDTAEEILERCLAGYQQPETSHPTQTTDLVIVKGVDMDKPVKAALEAKEMGVACERSASWGVGGGNASLDLAGPRAKVYELLIKWGHEPELFLKS